MNPMMAPPTESTQEIKKVLFLGSGFVVRPCAEYLARNPLNKLTIASRTLDAAKKVALGLPNTRALFLDATSIPALDAEVAAHDLVISFLPYTRHAAVIKSAIKGKTHVVTTSYISPEIRELDSEAKKAGIVVMNEIGLDPGIDHIYAIKTINEVHEMGGRVTQFLSYCGSLPAPECDDNPLGKFAWSPRGWVQGLINPASYISGGKRVDVAGPELMKHSQPYFVTPKFKFVAYPNRNSLPFKEFYKIPEAETVIRGSLRYPGFPELIQAVVEMGWLDVTEKEWLNKNLTWAQVTQRAIGSDEATESCLVSRIKAICKFPSEAESTRILSGLKWMGLLSDEKIQLRNRNLLDTLCARLQTLMKYKPGERDLIMLQHKFIIQWKDGSEETRTSTLELYGNPTGHSALAWAVGLPCGIATQLVLDGVLAIPGVQAPYSKEICDPIRKIVEREGISFVEKTL